MSILTMSILFCGLFSTAFAQEEPTTEKEYEREELGVNRFTAPSIDQIFEQLDRLKRLPFEQLWREFPPAAPAKREQKALIFGGLVPDGFLIVESEKRNLVDDLGRILIREARGLGVAERVMKHSASLTELGQRGDWVAVRKELVATQNDVEQALVDLRDQKIAHLIGLGGWLRGLEISSGAVEKEFSTVRAQVLAQPQLLDYFEEELTTMPPTLSHTPLFEKIRAGVREIHETFAKAKNGLRLEDVKSIHAQARELNLAMRRYD